MDYKIDYFETHDDERGRLVVFLKESELANDYKRFGQIYFVTFNERGIIRGNHYHKKWREWFGVVTGKTEVKLKDVNTGEEKFFILDGDLEKYVRLEVGPNIVHAFRSLSDELALLNYADGEWHSHDTFKYELFNL